MGKHAYLIISDLHKTHKNFRNRISYGAELEFVQQKIFDTAQKYRSSGCSVALIFLGDIFHSSYSDVFQAVRDNNFFILLSASAGRMYTVMGNHELTHYTSNPFYTLLTEISSKKVRRIMRSVWTPAGIMPIMRVVDELADGEVIFHFNHYSTPAADPSAWQRANGREGESLVHVGLFHHDFACREITDLMKQKLGSSIYAADVGADAYSVLKDYSYCFFGHMHSVYGTFATDYGTKLCYLASLGRTNEREVNDDFLERNIPAVIVEDGRFAAAEDNVFDIMGRAACVKERGVEVSHEEYAVQKMKNKIKSYAPATDRPVENVKAVLAADSYATQIFTDYLRGDINSIGRAVDQNIAEVNKLLLNLL